MADGRPKSENPREHLVTVRFTAHEKKTLMERAEELGTSVSEFIRRVLKACLPAGFFKSDAKAEKLEETKEDC